MERMERINWALSRTLDTISAKPAPPLLAEAMRYAVFPGGARIRPRLCLSVAVACGDDRPAITDGAACAIEMLHCASLVHDDMPCFDNAAIRRGKPSVHVAYGEDLALLVGDALIVLAFELLADAAADTPQRLAPLTKRVAGSVGMPLGIVAGQAWECERQVDLAHYHRTKTASLFAAATMAGAEAAGHYPGPWQTLGEKLGDAYQVADDLRDATATPEEIGKPVGQDEAFDRPNMVRERGLDATVLELKTLISDAIESIPKCPGAAELRDLVRNESRYFLPKKLAERAA